MIKSEFKRRLIKLNNEINRSLASDCLTGNFFAFLYQVVSFMWCKTPDDLEHKKKR